MGSDGMDAMTIKTVLTTHLFVGVCAIGISGAYHLALPTSVSAAVFKCTDANGNVSYNQTPCAAEEKAETLLNVKSTKKVSVDCRIANNFTRQIATRMKSGESSGAVFDSFGGIDAVPRSSVGVINYVYSHKGNVDTSTQRITALSAARCSAGSYGSVSCNDFPYDFVASLGGCERAAMTAAAGSQKTMPNNEASRANDQTLTWC